MGNGETLTHRDLVEPVGLLEKESRVRTGSEPGQNCHHHQNLTPRLHCCDPPEPWHFMSRGGSEVLTSDTSRHSRPARTSCPSSSYDQSCRGHRVKERAQKSRGRIAPRRCPHLLRVSVVTRPQDDGAALLADPPLRHQAASGC